MADIPTGYVPGAHAGKDVKDHLTTGMVPTEDRDDFFGDYTSHAGEITKSQIRSIGGGQQRQGGE